VRRGGADAVNGFYPILNLSKIPQLALFMIFTGLIIGTAYTGENPFVYFQF
jgi:alginate O-acetyltransferase complex protein AlgI